MKTFHLTASYYFVISKIGSLEFNRMFYCYRRENLFFLRLKRNYFEDVKKSNASFWEKVEGDKENIVYLRY